MVAHGMGQAMYYRSLDDLHPDTRVAVLLPGRPSDPVVRLLWLYEVGLIYRDGQTFKEVGPSYRQPGAEPACDAVCHGRPRLHGGRPPPSDHPRYGIRDLKSVRVWVWMCTPARSCQRRSTGRPVN